MAGKMVMEAAGTYLTPEGEGVVAIEGTARGWDAVAVIECDIQILPAIPGPRDLVQAPRGERTKTSAGAG